MNPWPGRATLSPAELAQALGKHPRTIRRWVKAGELRAVIVRGRPLIPIEEALRITGHTDAALQAASTELVQRPAAPPVIRPRSAAERSVAHW